MEDFSAIWFDLIWDLSCLSNLKKNTKHKMYQSNTFESPLAIEIRIFYDLSKVVRIVAYLGGFTCSLEPGI